MRTGAIFVFAFNRPGGDLLSRVLRRSTIGAEAFDFRVRDGIGSGSLAMTTRPVKSKFEKLVHILSVNALHSPFADLRVSALRKSLE